MTKHEHTVPSALQLTELAQAARHGDDAAAGAIAGPFHDCLSGVLILTHSIFVLAETIARGYIGGSINLGAGVDDELRAVDDPAVPAFTRAAVIFGNHVASGEHAQAVSSLRASILELDGSQRTDFVLSVEMVGLHMLADLLAADPQGVRARGGRL